MSYAQAITNLHPNSQWRSTAPNGYTGNHVGAGRFDPAWGETEYNNNISVAGPDQKATWSAVQAEATAIQAQTDAMAQVELGTRVG